MGLTGRGVSTLLEIQQELAAAAGPDRERIRFQPFLRFNHIGTA
jgi:hypothetical protein